MRNQGHLRARLGNDGSSGLGGRANSAVVNQAADRAAILCLMNSWGFATLPVCRCCSYDDSWNSRASEDFHQLQENSLLTVAQAGSADSEWSAW